MAKKVKKELKSSISDKEKVLSLYPRAFVEQMDDRYTICDNEGTDILCEYLLPYGKTPEQAWEYASLTIKTTNHFNRTHPERLSLELEEEKSSRITRRRSK